MQKIWGCCRSKVNKRRLRQVAQRARLRGKWRRQLQLIAYFKRFQIKTADNVNNNNNNNNSTLRLMPIENIKNEQKAEQKSWVVNINCSLWQKFNNYDNKKFKNHIATKIIKHMIRIMRNANSIRVEYWTFLWRYITK